MKTIRTVLFALSALCHQASAKAYFQPKEEMIEKAEVIAVISVSAVQDSDAKGEVWSYRKSADAKVETVLKGDIPKVFRIHGAETFICASCPISEGRFLAFLKKDGDLWAGSNWQFSLRPIHETNVQWYGGGENSFEMKLAPLDAIVSEIKKIMASKTVNSAASRRATVGEK